MKEFPKFDFNGISYDLNFYDDSVKLYAVQNVYSGVMVSQIIPAANDYVAALGFKNFVDKQKEQKDNQPYQLLSIGIFNTSKIEIEDKEKENLFKSTDDLEDWIKKAELFMESWNEED